MMAEEEKARILVVDDNYALLEVLRDHLLEWGYDPTLTTSGSEANSLLEREHFHVVLADLRMSPVSGWEVIKKAKGCEGTEVVVMTGYASLENSLEAVQHRVFGFIPKPIRFPALRETLSNAVRQSRQALDRMRQIEDQIARTRKLETKVEKVRTELREISLVDDLTGLYNRRFLKNVLRKEVDRSLRHRRPLSLALLDLDHFRRINDRRGYSTGNEVLEEVAELLEREGRPGDVVCRVGGEEFVLLFPSTSKEEAVQRVRKIQEGLSSRKIPLGEGSFLTVSAGVVSCPGDTDRADELLEKARRALEQAQQTGTGRLVLA